MPTSKDLSHFGLRFRNTGMILEINEQAPYQRQL
jgi:hypothetical protein